MDRIFEYDPAKSINNWVNHGIDFEEAKEIFEDPYLFEQRLPERPEDEEVRYMCFGLRRGKVWVAVVTYRGDHGECTRLISVRQPEGHERGVYERYSGR